MNTLHKFAVLTLSAVLTVCLLAGAWPDAAGRSGSSLRTRCMFRGLRT